MNYRYPIALGLMYFAAAYSSELRDDTRGAVAGGDVNWAFPGGDNAESNHSSLNQIDGNSIRRLSLAWSLDLPGEQSLEATPLAVDGVLYFSGSHSDVYAVDAVTGTLRWRYNANVTGQANNRMATVFAVNRGVAYSQGKIYVGTLDGRLIALRAQTGQPVWSTLTVPDGSMQTVTGAPRVFKKQVVIGNGGADYGARGYVTAFDIETGKQVWRFYTVPGDPAVDGDNAAMRMAAKTWAPGHWKVSGGGGTVWDAIAYDSELNQLYIAVGNAGPYNPAIRSPGGGDNLFTNSIVALNPDTGKYLWHYQLNPNEAWDYDSTQQMILAEVSIGGAKRKVLMQAPKNGFFYVIDRISGKLISAEKIGKVTWANSIDVKSGRPVEKPGIRYEKGPADIWPGIVGAHNWQRMAYDPQSRLAYIPYMQLGNRFSTAPLKDSLNLGGVNVAALVLDRRDGTGALIAWDPVARTRRWTQQHSSLWNGGVLSTSGGLVFQGTADGQLVAYDSGTGKNLWAFSVGHGVIAPPITYAVAGTQYISVLSGYGGGIAGWSKLFNRGWKYGQQPRRLLTFVLDGKGLLPPTAPADFEVHALDDRNIQITKPAVAMGAQIYATNCMLCHGKDLVSAGSPAPDLRESHLALSLSSFRDVVQRGTRKQYGMPDFDAISEAELRAIFMYVRSGARDYLKQHKTKTESSTVSPAMISAFGRSSHPADGGIH